MVRKFNWSGKWFETNPTGLKKTEPKYGFLLGLGGLTEDRACMLSYLNLL